MPVAFLALVTAGAACTWSPNRAAEGGDRATIGATSPVGSAPPPSFASDDGWDVVLAEEFDAPLGDRWSTCHWWADETGCRIGSSGELQWYVPEQVGVRDGALVLTADRRDDGDHPIVSGMVQSGSPDQSAPPGFAFTYGAVEARVRLPAGAGVWPAVWMLPTSTRSRPEIDILELYGQEPDVMRMHLHWADEDDEPRQEGEYTDGVDLTQGWHTVGVRWEPGRVTWYRDGAEQWRVERSEVPTEPMYLVLNLAIGGDRIGPPEGVEFPVEMRVDWIRVWRPAALP